MSGKKMEKWLKKELDTKVESFLAWFYGQGGQLFRPFQYALDDKMGLSLFTDCDLQPDIEAIFVPKSCCITASLARRQILALLDQSAKLDDDILSEKEWIVFYIFLHKIALSIDSGESNSRIGLDAPPKKRSRTEKSKLDSHLLHFPYIQLLPEETLTPLHYTKLELLLLTSTPLLGHAIESRRNGRKSCIKAVEWLHSTLKDAGPSGKDLNDLAQMLKIPKKMLAEKDNEAPIDYEREAENLETDEDIWPILEEWRWAETAYGSRAFPPRLLGEEDTAPVLIPGLDSFNHSREARVTWTWNNEPKEHITLTLHQALQKGKQVFNSYGPKSNEELIASYGFVNEDMDDDVVTLKLGGTSYQTSQQHQWRYQEECPPLLLEEVRAAMRQVEGDELVESELMQQGEAMATIGHLLETKIAAFEEAQEEVDKAIMQEGRSIRDHVWNCIDIYRRSQIRILHSALGQVQHCLDEIDAKLDSEEPVGTS